jgi:hypothetical protein
VSRKGRKPRERHAKPETAKRGHALSLLPMEIHVGDRFAAQGFEWEVLTHPAALHGAKSLRARIRRPGPPETEREMTWSAHERVEIRRTS